MPELSSSWSIGAVEIPSRIVLAPMAGVSVQAFRRQGRRFGAGLVCSEMVSAVGTDTAGHGPDGSLVVSVSVTPPAAMSAAEGA